MAARPVSPAPIRDPVMQGYPDPPSHRLGRWMIEVRERLNQRSAALADLPASTASDIPTVVSDLNDVIEKVNAILAAMRENGSLEE